MPITQENIPHSSRAPHASQAWVTDANGYSMRQLDWNVLDSHQDTLRPNQVNRGQIAKPTGRSVNLESILHEPEHAPVKDPTSRFFEPTWERSQLPVAFDSHLRRR